MTAQEPGATDAEASLEVAIVVPARNEGRFIRSCLRSIREQWFKAWECVIVDDGSHDETREIADEFAAKDDRFRVLSHSESRGLAASRNVGIEQTTAPLITFLDADDFLYQHSLRSRVEALTATAQRNAAGSFCDWQTTMERQGRTPPERSPADRKKIVGFIDGPECPFIATAPVLRRSVIDEMGGFDEELSTAEDFDLWIRILRAGYTFVYTPMIGVAYRQKSSGMVFTDTARHARASDEIIAAQFEDRSSDIPRPRFSNSLSDYQKDVARAKRLLRSLALAAAVDDPVGRDEIRTLLPESLALLASCGFDARFELGAGLGRAASGAPAMRDLARRQQLLEELLGEVLGAGS